MARMFNQQTDTKEGKYLVLRRDGTKPNWSHFVLGAADPAAPGTVIDYANRAAAMGMDPQYVADVRQHAHKMYAEIPALKAGDPDAPRHRIDSPLTVALMQGRVSLPDLEAAVRGVVEYATTAGADAKAVGRLVEVWQGARIGPAPVPPDVARAVAAFVKSAREAVAMCRDAASGSGRGVSPIVDRLEADADRLAVIGTGGPWAPPDGRGDALAELLGVAAAVVEADRKPPNVIPPRGIVERLRVAVDATAERFGMTVKPIEYGGPLVAGGKTPADAKRRAGFVEWMRSASQADLERVIGYTALDVGGAMLEAEGVKFVECFPPGPAAVGWREVAVVAPVGTSFGIVEKDGGSLTLSMRPFDSSMWAHGVQPVTGVNTIGEGFTRYVVTYNGDLPPGELRAADLEDGIRHALDMMTAIQAAHPEVSEEGWAELRAVSNHLQGTIAGAGVPSGDDDPVPKIDPKKTVEPIRQPGL